MEPAAVPGANEFQKILDKEERWQVRALNLNQRQGQDPLMSQRLWELHADRTDGGEVMVLLNGREQPASRAYDVARYDTEEPKVNLNGHTMPTTEAYARLDILINHYIHTCPRAHEEEYFMDPRLNNDATVVMDGHTMKALDAHILASTLFGQEVTLGGDVMRLAEADRYLYEIRHSHMPGASHEARQRFQACWIPLYQLK